MTPFSKSTAFFRKKKDPTLVLVFRFLGLFAFSFYGNFINLLFTRRKEKIIFMTLFDEVIFLFSIVAAHKSLFLPFSLPNRIPMAGESVMKPSTVLLPGGVSDTLTDLLYSNSNANRNNISFHVLIFYGFHRQQCDIKWLIEGGLGKIHEPPNQEDFGKKIREKRQTEMVLITHNANGSIP